MAFSINEFRANMAANGGLLKNNKFLVRITPPRIMLNNNATGINKYLEYYAESATIPGISFQTSEVRRQGVGNLEKAVWGAAFTDCDISFRIDQKTQVWNFFQLWMDQIYNFNMNNANGRNGTLFEMEYKDNYATPMSIFVYNEIKSETPVITIDLVDAFPLSISDMAINWGSSEHIKLNVRFNFRSWHERDATRDNSVINNDPSKYFRISRAVNTSDNYSPTRLSGSQLEQGQNINRAIGVYAPTNPSGSPLEQLQNITNTRGVNRNSNIKTITV